MRYSIGQRWFCKGQYGDFCFVIVGTGSKPDRKLVHIEYVDPKHPFQADEPIQELTHKHLKKYSSLIKKSV